MLSRLSGLTYFWRKQDVRIEIITHPSSPNTITVQPPGHNHTTGANQAIDCHFENCNLGFYMMESWSKNEGVQVSVMVL